MPHEPAPFHSVVRCINYIVGHKALDITVDRDRSFLDPRVSSSAIPAFALP